MNRDLYCDWTRIADPIRHQLGGASSMVVLKEDPLISFASFQIPVHHHSDIYSSILPLEEGHRIQAFSRYPCLVQQVGGA